MSDDKLKQTIKEMFRDPQIQARVVNAITPRKRPAGWSSRASAPYYKEMYGQQMKEDADLMLKSLEDKDPKELIYRYDAWCGLSRERMSETTLYNRLNQSIRFLIDYMDTEDKRYARWYDSVRLHKSPERQAIVIYFSDTAVDIMSGRRIRPELIEPHKQKAVWEQQMENWITGNTTQPFIKEGLLLSPEEIVELKTRFATLENILADISTCAVRLIKLQ